jgi:hypothetical protein
MDELVCAVFGLAMGYYDIRARDMAVRVPGSAPAIAEFPAVPRPMVTFVNDVAPHSVHGSN